MRRALFVGALLLLIAPAVMGAGGRGRISRQGTPGPVVSNPDPPPVSFFENTNLRTITTSGYCTGAHNGPNAGPAAGSNKVWLAWMDNSGGCDTGVHNIKAQMVWDYTTGTSDADVTVDSINPSSSDRHDAPTIIRNPTGGKLFVTYGSITAAGSSPFTSPFYRESTSGNSIAAFDAISRVTGGVALTEIVGGYTTDGTLHLIGQGPNQNLGYYSRSSGGTWTATSDLVRDGGGTPGSPATSNGFQGDPTCQPGVFITGNTLYVIWTRNVSGCSGSFKDIFLIKSTDSGANWCAIDGTNCFSRSTKLTGIFNSPRVENLYDYPAVYRVHTGDITGGTWRVVVPSNGRPVIVFSDASAMKAKLYSGSGSGTSSFSTVTINSSATNGDTALAVTSTDKLLAYAATGSTGLGNFVEFISTDGGSTWPTSNTLRVKSTETRNQQANVACYTSLGGKERCLVTWIQTFTGTATSVMFMDRPQS